MAYLHWKLVDNCYQFFADDILLVDCHLLEKKFIVDQTQYYTQTHDNYLLCYEANSINEIARLEANKQEGIIYFKDQVNYSFRLQQSTITVYALDNLVFSLHNHDDQFSIQTGIALFEADLFLLLVGFVFTFFANINLKRTIVC